MKQRDLRKTPRDFLVRLGDTQLVHPPLSYANPQVALFAFVSTPLIEKGADKKYGGQVAYQEYKRRTPCMTFRLS